MNLTLGYDGSEDANHVRLAASVHLDTCHMFISGHLMDVLERSQACKCSTLSAMASLWVGREYDYTRISAINNHTV